MRIKISFSRSHNSTNSIPLHHQKLLSDSLHKVVNQLEGVTTDCYNFSSLKGTSRIQNGFMQFLSSKVTLVISSNSEDFMESLVKKIFEQQIVRVGKLELMPKSQEIIHEPEFSTKMKYVCISPIILLNPKTNPAENENALDPSSNHFSDLLFQAVMDRMEVMGFSNEELNSFSVFEVTPDKDYVSKILSSRKKFARLYKDNNDNPMIGYLLPFMLHAHPKVHQFIWNCGIGLLNKEGYGMIDVTKDA